MSTESSYISFLMDKVIAEEVDKGNTRGARQQSGSQRQGTRRRRNVQVNEVGSSTTERASIRTQTPFDLDRLMKSAGHYPAPNQECELVRWPRMVPPQTVPSQQQINTPLNYSDSNIFQQQNMFWSQQQTLTQNLSREFNPIISQTRVPQLNHGDQTKQNVSPSQQASDVYPVGEIIPAGFLLHASQPNTARHPQPNIQTEYGDIQHTPQLQSCCFKQQDAIQRFPDVNPFIHPNFSDPLSSFGNISSAATTQSQLNSGKEQIDGTCPGSDRTGSTQAIDLQNRSDTQHVDIVGDAMFLRNDSKAESDSCLCNRCAQIFKSLPELELHLKKDHSKEENCKLSQYRHTSNHNLPLVRCGICGADFFFNSDLKEHHQTVHVPFMQERLRSRYASNKSTVSVDSNITNMTEKSDDIMDRVLGNSGQSKSLGAETDKLLDSKKENTSFVKSTNERTEVYLESNKRLTLDISAGTSEIHISDRKNTEDKQTDSEAGFDIEHASSLSCLTCSQTFKTESDYSEHMENEHASKQEISFKQTGDLVSDTDHGISSDTEHGTSWLCSVCPESFTSESAFREHMKQEHNEKQEKSFKQHIDCNSGTKLLHCEVCGSDFFFELDLKDHQDTAHDFVDVCNDTSDIDLTEILINSTPDEFGPNMAAGRGRKANKLESLKHPSVRRGRYRPRSRRHIRWAVQFSGDRKRSFTDSHIGQVSSEDSVELEQMNAAAIGSREKGNKECQIEPSVRRRRGRHRGRGQNNAYQEGQKAVEKPYMSEESDLEIIEEPAVVIEINDQDGDSVSAGNSETDLNNFHEGLEKSDSGLFLSFYCGLCAFKSKYSDALDAHMETHSLVSEISETDKEKIDATKRTLLGNKYVTVHLKKLPLTKSVCLSGKQNEKNIKSKNSKDVGSYEVSEDASFDVGIDSLLQKAGLGTLLIPSEQTEERKSRQRRTVADKAQLENYKIKETSTVLSSLETPCTSNNKDRSDKGAVDWLAGFNDDDESDLDWDSSLPVFGDADDGYEADDNSDIVQFQKRRIEQQKQKSVSHFSTLSKPYQDTLKRYNIKESKIIIMDMNKEKLGNRNVRKRPLRSAEGKKIIVPEKIPKRNTGQQTSSSNFITANLLKKYGIREARVCLDNKLETENKVQKCIKRENSQINVTKASWWDAKNVRDEIDFSKTPIVLLERIEMTGGMVAKGIVTKGKNFSEAVNISVCPKRALRSKTIVINGSARSIDLLEKEIKKEESKEKMMHLKETKASYIRAGAADTYGKQLRSKGNKIESSHSVKKNIINLCKHNLMKKSLRLMNMERSTRRRAFEIATSLLKKPIERHIVKKTLANGEKSKDIQKYDKVNVTKNKKHDILHQRKKKALLSASKNKATSSLSSNTCEVKIFRLTADDIENWKQKEIETEKKLKAQMTRMLSPEKMKSKVMLDRLAPSVISRSAKGIDHFDKMKPKISLEKMPISCKGKHCEVRISRLKVEDIENWKQIGIGNTRKAKTIEIVPLAKMESRIMLDKLPPSAEQTGPINTDNAKQNLTSELDNGNLMHRTVVAVNQMDNNDPSQIAKNLLDDVINSLFEKCRISVREYDSAAERIVSEIVVELIENACIISEQSDENAESSVDSQP